MEKRTDWTSYYQKPYSTASYSRRITGNIIVKLLQKYVAMPCRIAELGGGNSCFYEIIRKRINPERYVILDNNDYGIQKFIERIDCDEKVGAELFDALNPSVPDENFNIVLSFGLIEHFSPADTARVIATHFDLLEEGGICLMTFPTPSWSYRLTRYMSELLKLWIFHDERPLKMLEVENECEKYGVLLKKMINNKIILSQGIVVFRKTAK